MTPANVAYIDDHQSCCLCDIGLPGWRATVCVADDGRHDLVLVNTEFLGDPRATYDPITTQAPHEQPGPLPSRWRDRVQLAPLRCGRPTKSGRPCRAPIPQPGDTCGHHRNTNKEQTATDDHR